MSNINEMMVAGVSGGALAESESQRAIAEVQASMILAKRFPRDPLESIDRIKTACQRPGLAEQALYTYQRGGTDVSGPSIRLAEAVAQHWKNIQYGIRELSQRNGESTVEAYAWDVETNTKSVKVFQVPHVRYTRLGGNKILEDPRDIYEVIANNGARRLRACILAVIPGDVIETAQLECEETLKSQADTSPQNMKKMVAAFEPHNVTKEMIEKRIGRKLDAITPAQVVSLRKVLNSLKDGMSTPSDWFDTGKKKGADQDDQPLSDQITPKKAQPKSEESTPEVKEPEVVQEQESAEEKENDSDNPVGMSSLEIRNRIYEILAHEHNADAEKMNESLRVVTGDSKVTVDEIAMFDPKALPIVLDAIEDHFNKNEG